VLLAGAAAAYVLGYRAHESRHAASTSSQAATTAPPQPRVFAVTTSTAEASAFAATIHWSTSQPSTARLQWGPHGVLPVLWDTAPDLGFDHSLDLTGLAPSTSYDVTIDASSPSGGAARGIVTFTTPTIPATVHGSVRGGALTVDGDPVLPLMAWRQCSDQWTTSVAAGIDLYAGNACGDLSGLLHGIAGRGLVAGVTDEDAVDGTVGWFYPDEADARGYTGETLPALPPGVRFLTVTAHFAEGAAASPGEQTTVRSLIGAADVVGFDLYPLQELCHPELLSADFDVQQQLAVLAPEKPTFQWIEARDMRCGPGAGIDVTPTTIEVESWLALAGGAHALGFFPPDWSQDAPAAIRRVADEVNQLAPALLQPTRPVEVAPAGAVRASARSYHGALYVIAVNAGSTAAPVKLRVADLGDRSLLVLGGSGTRVGHAGTVDDTLPPLSVRIYVAPPA
jgi:hypothetical protein